MNQSNNLSRYRAELTDTANQLANVDQRSHVIQQGDSYLVGALASMVSDENWDKAVGIALEAATNIARRIHP